MRSDSKRARDGDPEAARFAAQFRFRCGAEATSVIDLLGQAFGELSSREFERWIAAGQVAIGEQRRLARRFGERVRAGEEVAVSRLAEATLPRFEAEARRWRVRIDAPPFERAELDLRIEARAAAGNEPRQRARNRKPKARRGGLWLVVEKRAGAFCEVSLESEVELSGDAICAALAESGLPVVGDVVRGGTLCRTGLALCQDGDVLSEPAPEPGRAGAASELPRLEISAQTAAVMERGHPWVLKDEMTGDSSRFSPGTRVLLEVRGDAVAEALVEGREGLVARRWSLGQSSGKGALGEQAARRVTRAVDRRSALAAAAGDALRWIHGEADGLPGLHCDRYGAALRLVRMGRACDEIAGPVLEVLRERIDRETGPAGGAIVEVLHARLSLRGRAERVRVVHGGAALAAAEDAARNELLEAGVDPERYAGPGRVVADERGLRFLLDLGVSEPYRSRPGVGLFVDQRENRARVAQCAAGGSWLNLFAHTGAFSVALLAAGARRVASVDLSAAYLGWLEANLALNRARFEPSAEHESIRGEGRRMLENLSKRDRYDGIVLDPPTAAASGRRFWSARKDLEPLVALALRHLAPGGVLLVANNGRNPRKRDDLTKLCERAARTAQAPIASIESAPAGEDFPSLDGFPEGEPFRAVQVRRRG